MGTESSIIEKVDNCVSKNQRIKKFDSAMTKLKDGSYNRETGLASKQYYKSEDYKIVLEEINKERPLNGSLKCSLKLASFFNLPRDTVEQF